MNRILVVFLALNVLHCGVCTVKPHIIEVNLFGELHAEIRIFEHYF